MLLPILPSSFKFLLWTVLLVQGRERRVDLSNFPFFSATSLILPWSSPLSLHSLIFLVYWHLSVALLVAQMVKRLPTMWETRVQSLGWEDPLEKEIATHSSTLAWKIPWTRSLVGYSLWGHKESDTTLCIWFSHTSIWGSLAGLTIFQGPACNQHCEMPSPNLCSILSQYFVQYMLIYMLKYMMWVYFI